MFLITPKSSSRRPQRDSAPQTSQESPPVSRPIAKITRARVQKACDRCRVKKIKCDGVVPCLRCSHDEVICVVSKRDPNDLRAASRGYITCLEIQQKSLIKTLQQISRTTPQAVNAADLKEILDTVRAHGYDFSNVSEVPVLDLLDSWDEVANGNIDQAGSRKRQRSMGDAPMAGTIPVIVPVDVPSSIGTRQHSSSNASSDDVVSRRENNKTSKTTTTTETQPVNWSIDSYLDHTTTTPRGYGYIPTLSHITSQSHHPPASDWDLPSTHLEIMEPDNSILELLSERMFIQRDCGGADMWWDPSLTTDMWWDPSLILNEGFHNGEVEMEAWA